MISTLKGNLLDRATTVATADTAMSSSGAMASWHNEACKQVQRGLTRTSRLTLTTQGLSFLNRKRRKSLLSPLTAQWAVVLYLYHQLWRKSSRKSCFRLNRQKLPWHEKEKYLRWTLAKGMCIVITQRNQVNELEGNQYLFCVLK